MYCLVTPILLRKISVPISLRETSDNRDVHLSFYKADMTELALRS